MPILTNCDVHALRGGKKISQSFSRVDVNRSSYLPQLHAEEVIITPSRSFFFSLKQMKSSEIDQELFTESYCRVCSAQLISESQRVAHYEVRRVMLESAGEPGVWFVVLGLLQIGNLTVGLKEIDKAGGSSF